MASTTLDLSIGHGTSTNWAYDIAVLGERISLSKTITVTHLRYVSGNDGYNSGGTLYLYRDSDAALLASVNTGTSGPIDSVQEYAISSVTLDANVGYTIAWRAIPVRSVPRDVSRPAHGHSNNGVTMTLKAGDGTQWTGSGNQSGYPNGVYATNTEFLVGLRGTYNDPPNAPTGLGPTGATGSNNITFYAAVSDPNGDQVRARFEYSTDNANWTEVFGTYVASGQQSQLSSPIALTANTTYYLRARSQDLTGAISGYSGTVTFTTNRPPTTPGTPTVTPNPVNTNGTIAWAASTDPDGHPVQYWVDLSTNGGSTYSRIIDNVTGTSVTYNFANVPATSSARVRVMAGQNPDVGAYSAYAVSNVFTVEHNRAPLAPTNLVPSSGTFDRASAQTFSYTFNDPDAGDTQSKRDLQYRLVGATTWTTVTTTTTSTSHVFAAGTFAAGDYEWQVRTYDALGVVSPWSASGFFTAANVPAGLSITSPTNNSTVGQSTAVFWSAPSQDAVEVRRVADNNGAPLETTVYWTSGILETTTRRDHALTFDVNNRFEHIQVRYRLTGLWSAWVSIRVSVSYTVPRPPYATLEPRKTSGTLHVAITNLAPGNLMPSDAASSFEDGTLGGWTANTNATVANAVTTAAFHGTRALLITHATAGSATGGYRDVTTVIGQQYTVSGYVERSAGTQGVRLLVETASSYVAAPTTRTRLSLTFTATATTTRITFQNASSASAASTGTGAAFHLDAVQLETGTTASPYHPPTTPAVTSNEVWVDEGDGVERRYAKDVAGNGNWTFWVPKSLAKVKIRVKALAANGTTSFSTPETTTVLTDPALLTLGDFVEVDYESAGFVTSG